MPPFGPFLFFTHGVRSKTFLKFIKLNLKSFGSCSAFESFLIFSFLWHESQRVTRGKGPNVPQMTQNWRSIHVIPITVFQDSGRATAILVIFRGLVPPKGTATQTLEDKLQQVFKNFVNPPNSPQNFEMI